MEVDQYSFAPLVLTVAAGMGSEGRAFYSQLATLLNIKLKHTSIKKYLIKIVV